MSSFSPFWHLEVFPVWAAQLLLLWYVSQNRCCRAFPLKYHFYQRICRWFRSISLSAVSASATCSWDSWAYFHLPCTKTALRPPCSSLIIHIQARASWQVCWSHSMFCDSDNTFSLCGQKNAEAITLLEGRLVRPGWGWVSELELCCSADLPDPG